MPTRLPTESEAPLINPRCARLFFLRVSPALHVFPGDSSVLALRFSWRFFFPGGSRFLVITVSWRFPSGDSQHVLAGRGLVVLQLQLKVGSWLLLVPPRRLVLYLLVRAKISETLRLLPHCICRHPAKRYGWPLAKTKRIQLWQHTGQQDITYLGIGWA